GRVAQPAEQATRPRVPEPDRPRPDPVRSRLAHAQGETTVAAARGQERAVLRECDRIDLLEGTGRVPFRLAGREARALDRMVVAAADDRGAVGREGEGSDAIVVARHDPA